MVDKKTHLDCSYWLVNSSYDEVVLVYRRRPAAWWMQLWCWQRVEIVVYIYVNKKKQAV